MKALGEEIPTVDAQIGGHYTMDPKDALRAAEFVRSKTVIPMRDNTSPPAVDVLCRSKYNGFTSLNQRTAFLR